MKFPRAAGVLLHPTSLPGPHGIGDLGPDAHRFLDALAAAGLTIWQMLPLGPTGYGDSPYQSFSAFAGNPLLIHVPGAISAASAWADGASVVNFATVIPAKRAQLAALCAEFVATDAYEAFVAAECGWLEDYALFIALKEAHHGVAWTSWPDRYARRDAAALAAFRAEQHAVIRRVQIEQYLFFTQFHALRRACRTRNIALMGDVPIYVAHDSADVWANQELFQLHADGRLRVQAGVPPDYFSETGQLWGNPLYDWRVLREQGYRWWIARMRAALSMFDMIRLDHFRGFEAYWEVPGDAATAVNGQWVPGPGTDLFHAMTAALGPLPIVAENLGLITPEVEALRETMGYPGMSILQFAFAGNGLAKEFQPHTFPRERVVYTGTHDNDTTVGWWTAGAGGDSTRTQEEIDREHDFARRYLNTDGRDMHWTLMRAAMASVADTVLLPMQDLLGLGSEARMNLPGRPAGNWRFRFRWEQLTPTITARLRDLTRLYDR
ncbi:MAG: 4-alpha-glucanotransferase [Gemmatimonadaceae bacterium]